MHRASAFVTLTYAPDMLPVDLSVDPGELSGFVKRLRSRLEYLGAGPIRYVGVGEYGELTMRPHYHLSVFGLGVEHYELIGECWTKGYVYTVPFTRETGQYVSGYVVKKMTSKDDARLEGRKPEFARMSNRPGIGAGAMAFLASEMLRNKELIDKLDSFPAVVKIGGRDQVLGRYLRSKLLKEYGVTKEEAENMNRRFGIEASSAVQALLEASEEGERSLSEIVALKDKQKILTIEGRDKIFGKKGSL